MVSQTSVKGGTFALFLPTAIALVTHNIKKIKESWQPMEIISILILTPIIGLALVGLVSEFIRNDLEIRED